MKTITGLEIRSTSKAREKEIANIINTFDLLDNATQEALRTGNNFQECYEAQWTYHAISFRNYRSSSRHTITGGINGRT